MSYRSATWSTARSFLERAEPWLLRREDAHNLVLSLAYARRDAPDSEEEDALYGAVVDGHDRVAGCFLRTPPYKLLLTELPLEAADVVVEAVGARHPSIPAVLGPPGCAEAVAKAWTDLRGGSVRPGMEQRIYRLDEVASPPSSPGRLRKARPAEIDTAVAWGRGFAADAGTGFATSRGTVEGWIRRGELYLWDVDGTPRSIAVAHGRTPRGVRIGYVYTPPEERRRGWATALVAALSRRMLEDGYDFCVLYTDLSNPTSNAMYVRVGYQPLEDVQDFEVLTDEEEA